jgi:carbon-monoxide dehydrogenase large subunit
MSSTATPRYVGARVERVEDPIFLTGRAKFTGDIQLQRMLHVAFLRSPHAHARIVDIATERAAALPGVAGVFTGADFEGELGPYVITLDRPEVKTLTRPMFPKDKVVFVGEPIAVVVAESRYIAEDALDLIDVSWEPLPVVMDPEEALSPDAPLIHEDFGENNYGHIEFKNGDVDRLFAEADHVCSARVHAGRFMAAPLETRGVVAEYNPVTGEMTIWGASQLPHFLRTWISGPLGIPETKIRYIADAVGGGFGLKAHPFVEDVLVPALARKVGRPVKWIEDRYEHLAASMHSKEVICYLDAAVQSDGRITAFRGRYIGVAGAYQPMEWTSYIDPLAAASLLPSLYGIDGVAYEVDCAVTNRCESGAYRGVGWGPGHTAREILIDEIARGMGMDPAELRLRNLIPDAPYVSKTGMKYDGGSYSASMKKAMEMVDYTAFRERQRELWKQGRYIGIGITPYVEPTAWGSASAKAEGFPLDFFDAASVTVEPDGTVHVTTGCHNHGQSHFTTLAQVAADALGVQLDTVKVTEGDTARDVYGTGTFAGRTAVVAGGAIMRAGHEVREKLVRMAAHALEASPDDIELTGGVANVRGVPQRTMTVTEIAAFAYWGGDKRPEGEPALTATRTYDPPETYANGTVVAVVEVDRETGVVDLQRIYVCEDCGVMLNPTVVEGQVYGAIAQGIGGALYEDLPYGDDGQFLAGTLMDYLYPTTMEVPPMEVEHIETPSPVTEGGIKGVGEGGTMAAPAAVVNAIADALQPFGVRVTKTPLGPSDVLEMIQAGRSE